VRQHHQHQFSQQQQVGHPWLWRERHYVCGRRRGRRRHNLTWPVLVDSKGFTVYMLTADTKGHSTCSTQCLQYWPLVPAPAGADMPPVQGVSAALATSKATSGASMLIAGFA
jgi:hypothetical protein